MLPRLTTFLTTGAGMDARSGGKGSGGGAYLRGAGESQLEMDQRLFGKRIARIKTELAEVAARRGAARTKRSSDERLPLVALVGYTNAGKTSLLNALADAAEPLYPPGSEARGLPRTFETRALARSEGSVRARRPRRDDDHYVEVKGADTDL